MKPLFCSLLCKQSSSGEVVLLILCFARTLRATTSWRPRSSPSWRKWCMTLSCWPRRGRQQQTSSGIYCPPNSVVLFTLWRLDSLTFSSGLIRTLTQEDHGDSQITLEEVTPLVSLRETIRFWTLQSEEVKSLSFGRWGDWVEEGDMVPTSPVA